MTRATRADRRRGRSSVVRKDDFVRERSNGQDPDVETEREPMPADLPSGVRSVVLVEGPSDRAAVEALAARRGRALDAEGIAVVPIGGAQAIARALGRFGPRGLGLRVAGLCDAAEEADFRRALERIGLGSHLTRTRMERLGFYVCDADLEDELIRALGTRAVEDVVEARGELGALRTFRKQPAQAGRTREQQLRRFLGTRSGRKIEYARLLVDALDLARVPRPLDLVLGHVASP
jgi:OLD-like protein